MVESLYSKLYHPHQIALARVVERFDGDALDERWNVINTLSGSQAMNDAVDGGYRLQTGTTNLSAAKINMNGINHYDSLGVEIITVTNLISSTSLLWDFVGLAVQDLGNDYIKIRQDSLNTKLTLDRAITGSNVSTNLTSNFAVTGALIGKLNTNQTRAEAYINNILEATATTSLPNEIMQPFLRLINRTTVNKQADIIYCEVYNT